MGTIIFIVCYVLAAYGVSKALFKYQDSEFLTGFFSKREEKDSKLIKVISALWLPMTFLAVMAFILHILLELIDKVTTDD